jgi:hypothetical protein
MNVIRYRINHVMRVLTLNDEPLEALVHSESGEVINYFMNPAAHGNITRIETTNGVVETGLDDKYTVGTGVLAKYHAVTNPLDPTGPKVPAYVKKFQQATVRVVAVLEAWNPIQNAFDNYFIAMPDGTDTAEEAATVLLSQPDFVAALARPGATVDDLLLGFELKGGRRIEASNVRGDYAEVQIQGDSNLSIRGGLANGAAWTPFRRAWRVTLDDVGWAAKRGQSILLAPNKLAWALPDDVYNALAPAINYYGGLSQFRLLLQGEQVYAQNADGDWTTPVRIGDLLIRRSVDGKVETEFQYGTPRPAGMPTTPYSRQVYTVKETDENGNVVEKQVIVSDAYSV